MEIYNSEEEQIAALKRWWKTNGSSAISGTVIGILIIGVWNFWQSYVDGQNQLGSTMYQQLLIADKDNKTESVNKIAQQLTEKYASTVYAEYAQLMTAKYKVNAGDIDAAMAILQQLATSADAEIKNVANLRMTRLYLQKGEYEQGLQLIAELDQSSIQSFSASFEEIKGDLYVALDRLGEARTAYQNAIREGNSSPLLQLKLDDLATADLLDIQE